MNFHLDLSLNTLIISGVVGVVGWLIKGGLSVLIERLIDGAAEQAITNKSIEKLTDKVGDVEKLRHDLNKYYELYRELKTEFDKIRKYN